MKTRIFAFILVLASLLAFCGCSQKDAWVPAGMKLASTDAVDYTVYMPESWTVDVSTGIISAYVSNTDRSNVTVTAFNLSDDDAKLTLDEYWAKYEADLRLTFPDMKYLAEKDEAETTETTENAETEAAADTTEAAHPGYPTSTVIDNTAANKYFYTATVTGIGYQFMQVVIIRGGVAYIITYTSTPELFDTHIEEIDKITDNFKFAE